MQQALDDPVNLGTFDWYAAGTIIAQFYTNPCSWYSGQAGICNLEVTLQTHIVFPASYQVENICSISLWNHLCQGLLFNEFMLQIHVLRLSPCYLQWVARLGNLSLLQPLQHNELAPSIGDGWPVLMSASLSAGSRSGSLSSSCLPNRDLFSPNHYLRYKMNGCEPSLSLGKMMTIKRN